MGQRKLRTEFIPYVMMLFATVMIVESLLARQWYVTPVWIFNAGLNYRLWRNVRRRRAEEVLRKLQEAAWRTRSSS